jgi:hypothetical protein
MDTIGMPRAVNERCRRFPGAASMTVAAATLLHSDRRSWSLPHRRTPLTRVVRPARERLITMGEAIHL